MNPANMRRRQRAGSRHGRQRGMVLLVVLVVLVLTFLGGMSAIRAADTGNVIAGNLSFQQAAAQASDRALTDALTVIANRVAGGAGNTPVSM